MDVVDTSPVFNPPSFAASRIDPTGRPSGVTEIAPLYDLCPAAKAVPDAAESVIMLLAEWVRTRPMALSEVSTALTESR
jgi:hypothetical protein